MSGQTTSCNYPESLQLAGVRYGSYPANSRRTFRKGSHNGLIERVFDRIEYFLVFTGGLSMESGHVIRGEAPRILLNS